MTRHLLRVGDQTALEVIRHDQKEEARIALWVLRALRIRRGVHNMKMDGQAVIRPPPGNAHPCRGKDRRWRAAIFPIWKQITNHT